MQVTFLDKDNTQATSDPRRLIRDVDVNELKTAINTNDPAVTTSIVENEVPSGTINGSNTAFTIANTPVSGSLKVYSDGLRMRVTVDYSLSGTNLTMVTAPSTSLLVDYRKS